MDFLSLPQEMLVSVLKYVHFESLVQMRKLSFGIDSAVREYKLDNRKFDKMTISAVNGSTINVTLNYNNVRTAQFHRFHRNESVLQILQMYFPKMRRLSVIWLVGMDEPNRIAITPNVAECFMKHKELKLSQITLHNCEVRFDGNLLRKMIDTFPLKHFGLIAFIYDAKYNPFTDEFLNGLQIPAIALDPIRRAFPSNISLHGIEKLCSENVPEILTIERLKCTLLELGDFLEKNLGGWVKMIKQWKIGVEAGNMSKEETVEYITNLKCLEKYTIKPFYPRTSLFSIVDATRTDRDAGRFLYIAVNSHLNQDFHAYVVQ